MAQLIQLSFEPAYDAYHTMFRVERLMALFNKKIEYDKVRILDFYLCFPELIDQVRLRPEDRKFRRLSRTHRRSYAGKPDGRLAFNRMQPTQAAALQTLALSGFVASGDLELGWVRPTDKAVPPVLHSRISELNAEEAPLLEFIQALADKYPLAGTDGLKHRTGLMEYRYDTL